MPPLSGPDTRPREGGGGEKQPKLLLYQLFLSNFWMEGTRKVETSRRIWNVEICIWLD